MQIKNDIIIDTGDIVFYFLNKTPEDLYIGIVDHIWSFTSKVGQYNCAVRSLNGNYSGLFATTNLIKIPKTKLLDMVLSSKI